MKNLWEILVPTVRNDGRPFRLRYHRVWDEKVKAISGGLTIVAPVKGTWVSDDGEEYRERMIPVRILATREQMVAIAEMTMKYYEQLAVLAYKVSEDVIMVGEGSTEEHKGCGNGECCPVCSKKNLNYPFKCTDLDRPRANCEHA